MEQAGGDVPQVALTGGTIADEIHREIARLAPGTEVDWTRVDFFWGDERFVAPDSDDRNARVARADFLDRVGVDPARVHEMPSTADAADVDAAADVVRRPGARGGQPAASHLVMLGVGPDGHVASLFPGFAAARRRATRIAVPVTDSPKPPPGAGQPHLPALNRADEVWFVVSGADKAEAVGRALATPPPTCTRSPPSASAARPRPSGSSTTSPPRSL